jgi:TAT (twin-arginine translocation) pathway signal sequence
MNRRNFLTTSLAVGAIPLAASKASAKTEKVRLAFIGVV